MSLSKPMPHIPAGLGKSVHGACGILLRSGGAMTHSMLSVLPIVDHSQSETRCAQDVLCPEITAAQHEKVAFYVCVGGGHDLRNT